MSYGARIGAALFLALLLHLAGLRLVPALLASQPVPLPDAVPPPLVMTFRPPLPEPEVSEEPERARSLVESGAEADAPSPDTDLISDRDTMAQDREASETETGRPGVDEVDEFDQLATSPNTLPSEASPPQPEIPPMEESVENAPDPPAEAEVETAPIPPTPDEPPNEESGDPAAPRTLVAEAEAPAPAEPPMEAPPPEEPTESEQEEERPEQSPVEAMPERFQVAEAPPAQKIVEELNTSRGREAGGTRSTGIQSFEANRHELGAYMIHVRRKVERTWKRTLQLEYTGTSKTYAVLECSIRPDGTFEYVRIIEPGPSIAYAALCREALLAAGPFDAFPFDVPAIYREQNLVITWRFSFL